MKWLGVETPEEELGERFHSSPTLLAELNPGRKLDTAGERIAVPNVWCAVVRLELRVVVSKAGSALAPPAFCDLRVETGKLWWKRKAGSSQRPRPNRTILTVFNRMPASHPKDLCLA